MRLTCSTGGVSRFFLCKNTETLSDAIKAAFTFVMVVKLTPNRRAIPSNFTALVLFDVSCNSMICARLINFALCTPVVLNFSNALRCAAFSFISFFFIVYGVRIPAHGEQCLRIVIPDGMQSVL